MGISPKAVKKKTAEALSLVTQCPPPTQQLTDAQEELLKFVKEVESKIQMHHLALSSVPNTNATHLRTAATVRNLPRVFLSGNSGHVHIPGEVPLGTLCVCSHAPGPLGPAQLGGLASRQGRFGGWENF